MTSCLESLERRVLFSTLAGWSNSAIAAQHGQFAVEFDVSPISIGQDSSFGFSQGVADARADLAVMVRFLGNGTIVARNGSGLAAAKPLTYVPGATYRVRFEVDTADRVYSVWIRPAFGTEQNLADHYALRDDTPYQPLNNFAKYTSAGTAAARGVLVTNTNGTSRLALPHPGKLYHGVFPGGSDTWEADITPQQVTDYETAVGREVNWVYFSDNWFSDADKSFPTATASWIRSRGALPYIRLITTSARVRPANGPDPVYTLQRIIDGNFDDQFRQWAHGARDFGTAVMAEWGVEVNGDWFNWNGRWHGGGTTTGFGDPTKPDGPERFVAAYRHIIQIMRQEGADNVSWGFHVNWSDSPETSWNQFENYFPGSDTVDFVGISAYGPQRPTQNYSGLSFADEIGPAMDRVTAMGPYLPVLISEFGATVNNPVMSAQEYAGSALSALLGGQWPSVYGFSWWNERWQNDSDPAWNLFIDTDMRVQDSPALTSLFSSELADHFRALQNRIRVGTLLI